MVQIPLRSLDNKRYAVIDLDTGHALGTNLVLVDAEDLIAVEKQNLSTSPEVAFDVGTREGRQLTVEDLKPADSRIPKDLYQTMDKVIGHANYAPYVLDGQSAEITDTGDDYHDVVALVDEGQQHYAMKFTRGPGGDFEWRKL